MVIYKVTNRLNGMSYIGQTVRTMEARRRVHESCRENTYLQNAIREYGKENFEWTVVCECDDINELNEKEIHYIREYNTLRPNGYNLTNGGEGSFWTGENNPAKTAQSREKISFALRGRERPDMIDRNKAYTGITWEERFGEEKSTNMRQKKREFMTGRKIGPCSEKRRLNQRDKMSKFVWTITSPDGTIHQTTSLRQFCDEHGANRSTLMRAYNGLPSTWKVSRTTRN